MTTNVNYHNNSSLFVRFNDHVKVGLSDNIGENRPAANYVEQAGDAVISFAKLPKQALEAAARRTEDPRYVTVAMTVLALTVNSYVFYPVQTHEYVSAGVTHVVNFLKNIDILDEARLAGYVFSCAAILGYGLRAEGRFTNSELMQQFYGVKNAPSNPAGMTREEIAALKV